VSGGGSALGRALREHRPGWALPGAFLVDPEIHAVELDAIWRRSWLFAGVSADAAGAGDLFRFDVGDDSMIVVRDDTGTLHALHNTCRHRGMPVCAERSGRARGWLCPYHQWSYALDGTLLGCGGAGDEVERSDLGLRRAGVAEVGGLIFVWAGGAPPPFGEAGAALAAALAPQGLDSARVAHAIEYSVAADWKLVWQNNRECWHCRAGHPEYVLANFDVARDDAPTRALATSRARDHARALGALAEDRAGGDGWGAGADEHARPGLYGFPAAGRWWAANRTPLAPGFVTESLDGRPVAPPMGDYAAHDVGTLRVRTVPNFWCHASSDHAVLTRLVPDGPGRTLITVRWLVDAGAVEGRDYILESLLPFWRITSEQDWSLCERNQAGVRSPAYTPGPYSLSREANVIAFDDWYVERLRVASRSGG
jgi:Rieske 2Fe-2S family protein